MDFIRFALPTVPSPSDLMVLNTRGYNDRYVSHLTCVKKGVKGLASKQMQIKSFALLDPAWLNWSITAELFQWTTFSTRKYRSIQSTCRGSYRITRIMRLGSIIWQNFKRPTRAYGSCTRMDSMRHFPSKAQLLWLFCTVLWWVLLILAWNYTWNKTTGKNTTWVVSNLHCWLTCLEGWWTLRLLPDKFDHLALGSCI